MEENTQPAQEVPKDFMNCRPRRWRNKLNGKHFKAVPWFQPLDDATAFDFQGFLKDVFPEIFTNDVMRDFEVYRGLVVRMGWQILNEAGVWFCLQGDRGLEESFEDLGLWVDQEGPEASVTFPLYEEAEEGAE